MRLQIPGGAANIIETLTKAGYEAYVVGGCVRDSVLGKEPSDWDITTNARPKEVKCLFRHTVDTGIQHGTVTVLLEGQGFEVTTYRIDGTYQDHRRPDNVEFTSSLLEDLKRRDFTINAMAYNHQEGLIDKFQGISDLEHGIIRCVGVARERFDEDALRILRAVRFAAQLGFTIEEETQNAIKEQSVFLKDISAERIRVELDKLLRSEHPELLRTAYELGITKVVLPEFDEMMQTDQKTIHHCYSVGEHTLAVMQQLPATSIRWAGLLHDIAKPACKTQDEKGTDHFYRHPAVGATMADVIMKRLKFDNLTINYVKKLVACHDDGMDVEPTKNYIRKAINRIGPELYPDYLLLRRADVLGQSEYQRDEKLRRIENSKRLYEEVIRDQEAVTIKELAIDGTKLIALGFKPGKLIGETLNELLQVVLEDPEKNSYETLKGLALKKLE